MTGIYSINFNNALMKYAVNVSENAVVGLPMKISLRDLKIVLSAEDLISSIGNE